MTIKGSHTSLKELLTNFISCRRASSVELTCDACGMSFSKFRESSLVGCAECYRAFEGRLEPILKRAHKGSSHHVGKVPRRAGAGEQGE